VETMYAGTWQKCIVTLLGLSLLIRVYDANWRTCRPLNTEGRGNLNNWASCTSRSATAGGAAGVQYIPFVSTSLPDILWGKKKRNSVELVVSV
jgi:hypothetical protein